MRRMNGPLRLGLAGLALAAVIGGPALAWHLGLLAPAITKGRDAALVVTAGVGLRVQQVVVEGRRETPAQDVLSALDVRRGQAILAIDPRAARDRLEALPWVKSAAVERRLPDTLVVHLAERAPMALWQRDSELSLIDTQGVVIPGVDLGRFRELLIVVGVDAPEHVRTLQALLAHAPQIAKRVTAAVRVGKRRWDLRVDDRVVIRLPERDPHTALLRLASLESHHRLLERPLTVVDLRLPDRTILRAREGIAVPGAAPPRRKPAGQPT